jgi:hypothetical protein
MNIREAANLIKKFVKATYPQSCGIQVTCKGDSIQFTNLPMMTNAQMLGKQATGVEFEQSGYSAIRLRGN